MRSFEPVLVALCVTASPCILASAQESPTNASVAGQVVDPSGAAIPDTTVTAVQSSTNQPYTFRTDSQGRFRFSLLPPGRYRLTASARGFAQNSQMIDLSVGSAFNLRVQLSVE